MLTVAVASLALSALAAAAEPVGGSARTSRYLPMADGVRLAVDVHLPQGLPADARLPTILHQTRYWRGTEYRWPFSLYLDRLPAQGRLGKMKDGFIRRGYAWVDVDVRGSGASFGNRPWDLAPQEIRDGATVVDWIIAQPWSNGIVGAAGASYAGSTAELLLTNRHPAVRAAVPMMSVFDQYADLLAPGGVPLTFYFADWSRLTAQLDRNEVPRLDWKAPLVARGVRPVDGDAGRALLRAAVLEHADNYDFGSLASLTCRDDDPFADASVLSPGQLRARTLAVAQLEDWATHLGDGPVVDMTSPQTFADEVAASGAAVYSYSGWFDGAYANAAVLRFRSSRHPHRRLRIGPWDHALHEISPAGARGPSSFDHLGELLRFFDGNLLGVADDVPPVHYFTMGEERWKAATDWPPPSSPLPLYLAASGALRSEPPIEATAADRYAVRYDVGTGLDSRWNTLLGRPLLTPYPDRAAQDARLLVYTSAPLTAPLEVTGYPVADLFVRSTASDGAVFVYLEDVAPDGTVSYVTEGALRARHRRTADPQDSRLALPGVPYRTFRCADAAPVPPGETVELAFGLQPTSYLFRAGHSVRIAIAGADRDHFALIPAGAPPTIDVVRERKGPSRIELPVVAR